MGDQQAPMMLVKTLAMLLFVVVVTNANSSPPDEDVVQEFSEALVQRIKIKIPQSAHDKIKEGHAHDCTSNVEAPMYPSGWTGVKVGDTCKKNTPLPSCRVCCTLDVHLKCKGCTVFGSVVQGRQVGKMNGEDRKCRDSSKK